MLKVKKPDRLGTSIKSKKMLRHIVAWYEYCKCDILSHVSWYI